MLKRFRWELSLALTCLFFFIFQREVLVSYTLDSDELFSWSLATSEWSFLFKEGFRHGQQPLYYFLLKIWSFITPQNDYWVRLPSLLLGLGSIVYLFKMAKELFKENQVYLQGFFVLLFPQLIFYSTYARPYALLLFLSCLNLFFLLKKYFTEEKESKNLNLGFFLSLFALVLTHHVGFVYALALGISLFLLKKEEIKSPAFLILLLILVFEGILIFFQYSTARGATSWIEAPSLSLINGFVIRELSHWPFYLLGLFGFASLFKSKGRVEHLKFASLLTIVFSSLLLIISLTAIPLLVPRHFILLLPCFFLLFLGGAEFLKDQRSLLRLGLLIFLLTGGALLKTNKIFYEQRKDLKHFMKMLSKSRFKGSFHCISKENIPFYYRNYSKMYFSKDICVAYSKEFRGEFVISDGPKPESIKAYRLVSSFSEFKIYQKISDQP